MNDDRCCWNCGFEVGGICRATKLAWEPGGNKIGSGIRMCSMYTRASEEQKEETKRRYERLESSVCAGEF